MMACKNPADLRLAIAFVRTEMAAIDLDIKHVLAYRVLTLNFCIRPTKYTLPLIKKLLAA